jgi:hypothetical protein
MLRQVTEEPRFTRRNSLRGKLFLYAVGFLSVRRLGRG